MSFLLARVITLSFLWIVWLALGLFDPVNDEGQFGVSFAEFFDAADAFRAALLFFCVFRPT